MRVPLRNFLYIFLFLLSLGEGGRGFSQSKDEKILKGIDYIYKLKFDSSNAIFQSSVNQNPKDPTGYFFIAMQEWWRLILNKDDESNDNNYFEKVDKCVKVCEDRIDENEDDWWAIFLKGGVIGYRGILRSIRGSWLKAADDGREGLLLIQRSYDLNPSNKDAVFGIGLYNYAADYVFEAYPFLKTLMFFFPRGNKELGLSQLKDCSENAKFSRTEANFELCYINLNYEKNYYEAEKYADKLYKQYPENSMFEKFLGRCYAGENRWNESIAVWKDIMSKIDSSKFGYNNKNIKREAFYYLGLTNMRLNNLDEAVKDYEQALSLSKELDKNEETAFQVFSALGLGMLYDMKGNRSEAVKYYDMVLEMKDIEFSHDSAKDFKEKGYK